MMNQSYSNQNLYVQPPTRNPNLNTSNGFIEEKSDPAPNPAMLDDKNNLAPRGRLRGPLSDASLSQLDRDRANSMSGYGKSKRPDEPPRPPPPRAEGNNNLCLQIITALLDTDLKLENYCADVSSRVHYQSGHFHCFALVLN